MGHDRAQPDAAQAARGCYGFIGYSFDAKAMAETVGGAALAAAKAYGKYLTFMIVPGQSVYQQGKASFIGISTNSFCNGFPHLPLFFELPRKGCTVLQMAFIVCQARLNCTLSPNCHHFNRFSLIAMGFCQKELSSVALKCRIN